MAGFLRCDCGYVGTTFADFAAHRGACILSRPEVPVSAAPDNPSTGLEGLSDLELADWITVKASVWTEIKDGSRVDLLLQEAARRLRVPTGLSDAEILERAADITRERWPVADIPFYLRRIAKKLRSEQNTKEKDANN